MTENKIYYLFDQSGPNLFTIYQQYTGDPFEGKFYPNGHERQSTSENIYTGDWLVFNDNYADAINHIELIYKFPITFTADYYLKLHNEESYLHRYNEVPYNVAKILIRLRGRLEDNKNIVDDSIAAEKIKSRISYLIIECMRINKLSSTSVMTDKMLSNMRHDVTSHSLVTDLSYIDLEFIKWYLTTDKVIVDRAIDEGFYVNAPDETTWTVSPKEMRMANNEND